MMRKSGAVEYLEEIMDEFLLDDYVMKYAKV